MNPLANTLLIGTLAATGLSTITTNTSTTQTDIGSEQGVITTPYLNVRDVPSKNGEILGTLIQGQTVSILSKSNGWAKIVYSGKHAYISLSSIRIGNPPAPAAQSKSAIVTADRLNVRTAATTSSAIIGTLVQEQTVTIISSDHGWAKISYNGKDAYVSSDFLQMKDIPNFDKPQRAVVTATRLNVRSLGSTSSRILGTLEKDQSVDILNSDHGWAKISFNGNDAYVSLDFIQIKEDPANSNTPSQGGTTEGQSAVVKTDHLNVYYNASTSSNILGTLNQGQSVNILNVNNGWVKISYNGKGAFVPQDSLEFKNVPAANTTAQSTPQKSTDSQPQQGILNTYEQKVVDLTNLERKKNGLAALKVDETLSKIGRAKSQDMNNLNYFDHKSPTYGSPFDMMKKFGIDFHTAGENIAMGQTTPEEVVQAWMDSPDHRANILNSTYTYIGVGYVSGKNLWTQEFISK